MNNTVFDKKKSDHMIGIDAYKVYGKKMEDTCTLLRKINERGIKQNDEVLSFTFNYPNIRREFHRVDRGIFFHTSFSNHIAGSLLCKSKSVSKKIDYTLVDKIKLDGQVYKIGKTKLEKLDTEIEHDIEYCNIGKDGEGTSVITMKRMKKAKEEGKLFVLYGQNERQFIIFGLYKIKRIVRITEYDRFDYKYLLKLVHK